MNTASGPSHSAGCGCSACCRADGDGPAPGHAPDHGHAVHGHEGHGHEDHGHVHLRNPVTGRWAVEHRYDVAAPEARATPMAQAAPAGRESGFAFLGNKWGGQAVGTPGGEVSVSFAESNFPGQFGTFDAAIGDAELQAEVQAAFQAWEDVADIAFTFVPDAPDVDIRVGFEDIDGAGGTLGVATTPIGGPLDGVTIRFDSGEDWFVGGDAPPTEIDFSAVAIHEVGHAIGLDHSAVSPAIMQAFYDPDVLMLQADDIAAAQTLYGVDDDDGGNDEDDDDDGDVDGSGPAPLSDDFAGDSATTGAVAPGAPAQGRIEAPGDTDWFAVDLAAGASYRFELFGAPSGQGTLDDPVLEIRDAGGRLLARDDDGGQGLESRIDFTAVDSGQVFVVADGFSQSTGDYRLSVTQTGGAVGDGDVVADGPETEAALAIGQSVTGTVDAPGDEDWYRVELEAGIRYDFSVLGAPSHAGTLRDPLLRLYDAEGQLAAQDDDGGLGLESALSFAAPETGTYFLSAGAFAANVGTFELKAIQSDDKGQDDFSGDTTTRGRVEVGGTATGALETLGDRDWFAVELEAGETYGIDLDGEAGSGGLSDPVLSLHGPLGTQLAFDDDGGPGLNSRLLVTPQTTGTFFVNAQGFGSATGSYQLAVSNVNSPGGQDIAGGPGTQATLSVGGVATSELLPEGDTDWFRTELAAGQTVTIRLEGAGSGGGSLADPLVRLYDNLGLQLAVNDDGGSGLDSALVYTPVRSGPFFIEADSFLGQSVGSYRLSITPDLASQNLNVVRGSGAGETLVGTAGADLIDAGGGDDRLEGGTGIDVLDGGAGEDTAVFADSFADYLIERKSDELHVEHVDGSSGRAQILRIEVLEFADKTVSVAELQPDGDGDLGLDLLGLSWAEQVSALYVGYFGRAPDPAGHGGWIETLEDRFAAEGDAGAILSDVAESFRLSQEAQALFPVLAPESRPTAAEVDGFVTDVFENLFNRAPSADGLDFWSDAIGARLDDGVNIGDVIVDIIAGARDGEVVDLDGDGSGETTVQDATTVAHKIEVANTFGKALSQEAFDAMAAPMDTARDLIADVGADPKSVEDAQAAIDQAAIDALIPATQGLSDDADPLLG